MGIVLLLMTMSLALKLFNDWIVLEIYSCCFELMLCFLLGLCGLLLRNLSLEVPFILIAFSVFLMVYRLGGASFEFQFTYIERLVASLDLDGSPIFKTQ